MKTRCREPIMPDARLAVAIPTCSTRREDIRIGYVLEALALSGPSPYFAAMDIYIWDEGATSMTADRWVQLALDLLVRRGHAPFHMRRGPSRGVAEARRQLLEAVPPTYDKVLFLDDDLVPIPGAIDTLLASAMAVGQFGFVQGSKVELDANRTYHNDINLLTAADEAPVRRQWFGDGAFLLLNRAALRHVRWDIVSRYAEQDLPGEDVAMTLMIADHEPCYGVPAAIGYHMSLSQPRWLWEVPSDVLQLELLRNVVSNDTLCRAIPHLAHYLQGGAATATEEDIKSDG